MKAEENNKVINRLTPYTEPDREAIENEVWDFVNTVYGLSDEELYEIFCDGNYCEHSYQEAKAKYEAWKKQKDEVHVGDEVKCYDTNGVVVGIDTASEDSGVNVVCRDGSTGYIGMADVTKTGRHFDEVDELLRKMRGEQE